LPGVRFEKGEAHEGDDRTIAHAELAYPAIGRANLWSFVTYRPAA
jgi:hypothetical protein